MQFYNNKTYNILTNYKEIKEKDYNKDQRNIKDNSIDTSDKLLESLISNRFKDDNIDRYRSHVLIYFKINKGDITTYVTFCDLVGIEYYDEYKTVSMNKAIIKELDRTSRYIRTSLINFRNLIININLEDSTTSTTSTTSITSITRTNIDKLSTIIKDIILKSKCDIILIPIVFFKIPAYTFDRNELSITLRKNKETLDFCKKVMTI